MPEFDVAIVGGGAAGFFAAAACGEAARGTRIVVLEKSRTCLSKVRISGGGRCNVTHACFDPRVLSTYYPRGGAALLSPFHRFQPRDTIEWFRARGVRLKTESDGRMFPVTDSSETIVKCLVAAVNQTGTQVLTNRGVRRISSREPDGFELELENGERMRASRIMLATGGCRAMAAGSLPASLGHTIVSPVPSLFGFNLAGQEFKSLAGISLPAVEVSTPQFALRERGPLLFTHTGLSGPAILKLSAWGAREFHRAAYQFELKLNWLPSLSDTEVTSILAGLRSAHPARFAANTAPPQVPSRLWEQLLRITGVSRNTRWAELSRAMQHQMQQTLIGTRLQVCGKSLNQDEFVTCGGVSLKDVNLKTMESRLCPGLYFGGELLDIDALTGGFNFQAAWTTGWIAGQAMAVPSENCHNHKKTTKKHNES